MTSSNANVTFNQADSEDLYQNFENAFTSMLQSISSQVASHAYESDEVKANTDNIQRFLEAVRKLDQYFLQNRAVFVAKSPESLKLEEIQDLKTEINKKEMALQRYNEKLARWLPLANDLAQGKLPQAPPPPMQPGVPPGMGQRMAPMQMPPMGQPGMPQMQPGMQMPGRGPMIRPHGMPPGMMPGQGPSQFMPNVGQDPAGSGPLAYLERTTSNIGQGPK